MIEPMEVATPETLEIKASGTKIAEISKYGNNDDLYIVRDIDQKMELTSFCELMKIHFRRMNRAVYQLLLDCSDKGEVTIWVYLDKDHLSGLVPRKVTDNPQA